MRRLKFILVIIIVLAGLSASVAYAFVFKFLPVRNDPERFTRESISSILSGESRVYFRDGTTQLGAFFDVNHRVYVPYDSIPMHVIHALVAAEDARFFQHGGVDWRGVSRAMLANLRARRMVQGGSSLTQQTAKNIFGREDRSFAAKWQELQDALQLERNFDKEEILEFYLNQFYVSGTGRGLAIAAWHFFSKDLRDLTLAECAFIAGSVKGPARYDPFGKRTLAGREQALEAGRHRLTYVLNRMLKEGYITEEMRNQALATPLNFQRGQFRFALTTHLARLEELLDGPFYQKLFDSLGIDSWQKAQLEIVTSLDGDLQGEARRALQRNLSEIHLRLEGHSPPPKQNWPMRLQQAQRGDFLYGRVDSLVRDTKGNLKYAKVTFGQLQGMLRNKDLEDYARRALGAGGKKRSDAVGIRDFIKKYLVVGSTVMVTALDSGNVGAPISLQPASHPALQGGLVAVQNGEMVVSQGGFDNTGFDRVFQARRQFGSALKPLLYSLALHRGWHYLEELDNEWNLFSFQGQYYFPRSNQDDKASFVSLAWASALSENIASVWLLEQLHNRLSTADLLSLARERGHLPKEGQNRETFLLHLRDTLGLVPNQSVREEIEFVRARETLVAELELEGDPLGSRAVRRIHFGRNWEAEVRRRRQEAWNRSLLEHNWQRYSALLARGIQPEILTENMLSDSESLPFGLTISHLKRLQDLIRSPDPNADPLAEGNVLFWPDWRRSLAMHDFAGFLREIGVQSPVQTVLSMPLGANDITLAEMAVAYQSVITGLVWKCKDGDWNEPGWIREIRDAKGQTIFRNECISRRILDEETTTQLAVCLRAVITDGTGRSARTPLSLQAEGLGSLSFPAVGKTGTTNDYRNVAFAGALPMWDTARGAFSFDSAMSVASYVGHDDNRPLRAGAVRIAGSSGGLPQWMHFSSAVIQNKRMAESVDFLDLDLQMSGEAPLFLPRQKGHIALSTRTGLPPITQEEGLPTTQLPLIEHTDGLP